MCTLEHTRRSDDLNVAAYTMVPVALILMATVNYNVRSHGNSERIATSNLDTREEPVFLAGPPSFRSLFID